MLPGKTYTPDDILRILRKRFWLLVVPLAVISAVTAGAARHLPDWYRSETLILVVPQRVPESYVRVRFGTSASIELKEEPSELVIEVSDDGPGIKEDLLDKVLEPFFRIDDARKIDSENASYGLGLSIVDEIVRAHGGSLDLRNRKPHGLTARLCLPNIMSQHRRS